MPELADLPTSEGEQANTVTPDYVSGILDEAFKAVGGEVEPKEPPKEKEAPKEPSEETPEPREEEVPPEAEPDETEAEPEKKEEEKPEEKLYPEDKRQNRWNFLKKREKIADQLEKEIPLLQKQLAEFDGTKAERDSLRQQIAEAKTEREAIEHELYKGRVTSSRVFQDKVNKPFQNIEAAAQQLAKENELDGGQFMNLLVGGDKRAFKEFISGLDELDRYDAHTMFKDMRVVASERDRLLQDSRLVAEREAQEATQLQTQALQQRLQSRQTALSSEIIPGLTRNALSLIPEDKRPDLQKATQHVLNFDSWDPPLQMYSGMSAIILPELMDATKALKGQLADAQKEIAKLRKGSPKVGGGTTPSSNDTKEEEKISVDTSIENFAESVTKKIRGSLGMS